MTGDIRRTKKVIVAPNVHAKRAAIRAIIEAVAGFEPVTGALARLYQITHPPKSEQEREDWQNAITERSNEHDHRLDRHDELLVPQNIEFSGVTAQIIHIVGHSCPGGLAEHFLEMDDLKGRLPECLEDEIREGRKSSHILGS